MMSITEMASIIFERIANADGTNDDDRASQASKQRDVKLSSFPSLILL